VVRPVLILWGFKSEGGLDHYAHVLNQQKRIKLSYLCKFVPALHLRSPKSAVD
jgi:hypothetical protein